MKNIYEDILFARGFLVSDEGHYAADSMIALAKLFNIDLVSGAARANEHMIRVAQRNLGLDVPEPFYRGFPESVLELPGAALALEQRLYYAVTYGLKQGDRPGHSLFECEELSRTLFEENSDIRPFRVLTEKQAGEELHCILDNLLESTRPLNEQDYALVLEMVRDGILPSAIACKDTAARLLLDTRELRLADTLVLSDVIRLTEWMQYLGYGEKDIRHLNLKNQDRKLLTGVLDRLFRRGRCNVRDCFEKRQLWNGLLHHIHYIPHTEEAKEFVDMIRGGRNHSVMAEFEARMREDDVPGAVQALRTGKGAGAVLRHLDYLMSRCRKEADTAAVLDALDTGSKIILLQLMNRYSQRQPGLRTFRFARFGKLKKHEETYQQRARRTTVLEEEQLELLGREVEVRFAAACRGQLGRVYVDDTVKGVALPLQESTSQGGVGVLPRGTRITFPAGKKLRAFTYWEKVNDIDLSLMGFADDGTRHEFSWRSMWAKQSEGVAFSGDQTRGWYGGSEYFDIDLDEVRRLYPEIHYLVAFDNVYSGTPFQDCLCTAGYMMRDRLDSGEVFEPRTVKSSFRVSGDTTFAALFAVDLRRDQFVWLNTAIESSCRVAGSQDLDYLLSYLELADIMDLYRFAVLMAQEVVDDPAQADWVFSDAEGLSLKEGAQLVRPCDQDKVLALLNRKPERRREDGET